MIILKCETCNTEFKTKNKKSRFCSLKCMYKWRGENYSFLSTCDKCEKEFKKSKLQKDNFCSIECGKIIKVKNKNHPEIIEKKCECCKQKFTVTWKYRKQKLCSKNCMYEQRKEKSHKTLSCQHCDKEFESYNISTQKYCSVICSQISDEKREKLSIAFSGNKNPWHRPEVIEKIEQTKLEKYGNKKYNNIDQTQITNIEKYGEKYYSMTKEGIKRVKQTNLDRYGVSAGFMLNWRSGNKVSKVQKLVYDYVVTKYPTALLEYRFEDLQLFGDIYIPELKTIIEVNGDYWHLNPKIYSETAKNRKGKTAKELWENDRLRIQKFTNANYSVILLWESDIKKNKDNLEKIIGL